MGGFIEKQADLRLIISILSVTYTKKVSLHHLNLESLFDMLCQNKVEEGTQVGEMQLNTIGETLGMVQIW